MTDNELAYRKALKMERDRSRSRRQYRKGMFQENMLHLEHYLDFQDVENDEDDPRNAWISDKDAGAEQIVAGCDGDGGPTYYGKCIKRAMNRLRGHQELQKTLRLIVKHGNRREDSMREILDSGRCPTWEAAKTLYWTHLKKMLNIFCGQ